ncbi:hypothetical protein HDU86_004418 [Geranomyces michiganensis]|nr:hypothetical protein HDU86_004418 [Geranomyces michiganensis]
MDTVDAAFKDALAAMLTAHLPENEDNTTLLEYCILLVTMTRDKEALTADLLEVAPPETAAHISDWISKYMEIGADPGPNYSSMVISLDAKSDDELDDDDREVHPRRDRAATDSASAVEAADKIQNASDHEAGAAGAAKRKVGSVGENGDTKGADANGKDEPARKVQKTDTPPAGASVASSGEPVTPRCTFWPNCQRGAQCQFHHPTTACPDYPSCDKGVACRYIHPDAGQTPCRFGAACTRPYCAFGHPHFRGAGLGNRDGAYGRGGAYQGYGGSPRGAHGRGAHPPPSPASTHLAKVQCRFYPNCTNRACPYFHPVPKSVNGNGLSTTPTTTEVCKFEPLCSRENCKYTHPSRQLSDLTMNKSKKFDPPAAPEGVALPDQRRPSAVIPGAWTNRTLVLNKPASRPHISERSFALPDDGTVETLELKDSAERSTAAASTAAATPAVTENARILKGIIRQPRPAVVTEIEEEQQDGEWVETKISSHIKDSAFAQQPSTPASTSGGEKHHGSKKKRRVIKKVFESSVHGMPSSHTQTTTFFATYFYVALGWRWFAGEQHQHTVLLAVLCAFVNAFCLTTAWSRVHLNRHTPAQVGVGWVIGTLYAAGWFVLWQFYGVKEVGNSMFRSIGL